MKIVINKLQGSNVLAYGDFELNMDDETVYQLVGKNGSGKSSLPVILEEVLYNSNSRGIKKAKLVNRKTGKAGWWGQVDFTIGGDSYSVKKTVKTTAKVELTCNGKDISGHTATQTYSLIKQVLGDLDFKTFSKLVYQSMESSLDFLKATDTGRKKFLTGFLGLEKYSQVEVVLKDHKKQLETKLDHREGLLRGLRASIKRHSSLELVEVPTLAIEVPDHTEAIENLRTEIDEVKAYNLEAIHYNRNIESALKAVKEYKAAEERLEAHKSREPARAKKDYDPSQLSTCGNVLAALNSKMATAKSNYQKYKSEADATHCDVCKQPIDTSTQQELMEKYKAEFLELRAEREVLNEEHTLLLQEDATLKAYLAWERKYETDSILLAGKTKPTELEDTSERKYKTYSILEEQIRDLELEVDLAKELLSDAKIKIGKAETNNSLYEKAQKEMASCLEEEKELTEEITGLKQQLNSLAVLLKAFSPKGIIGYKIESSVKVFEEQINKYLGVFTKGQFALTFKLDGSKLQVVVYDSGEETDMVSLSSGEAAKVNISTLLAIRNLMSAVSKVNMNVLFLDEVISVLDAEAGDTLVDILLEEHELNTFLVSHNYVHPLTKTLRIEKEGKESKIIHG